MGRARFWYSMLAGELSLLASIVGCATAPRAIVTTPATLSEADEARAIEAAKRNPIAQPRARTLYPEQAPPPLPDHGLPDTAPPAILSRQSSDAPGPDPNNALAIAPTAPPNDYVDTPQYASPGPGYVWAPGYWSWSGTGYVWIGGDWLLGRPGYVYVGPRWGRSRYGWEFSSGGWSRGGTGLIVEPLHRNSYHSYQEYHDPGYRGSRPLGGGGYGDRRSDLAPTGQQADRPSMRSDHSMSQTSHTDPAPRSMSGGGEPHSTHATPSVTQAVRVQGGGGRSSSRATVHTRR